MDKSEVDGSAKNIAFAVVKTGVTPIGDFSCQRIDVNVCGQRYTLTRKTLSKYPSTRLGKIAASNPAEHILKSVCDLYDYYDAIRQEYYFERDVTIFPAVITYYLTGKVHVPRDVCVELYVDELQYWGIPFNPHDCCQGYHQQQWDLNETVRKTNQIFTDRTKRAMSVANGASQGGSVIDLTPESKYAKWKRRTWDLFEDPKSSKAASIVSLISSAMVVISTITLCANTHPDVQVKLADGTKTDNAILAKVEMVCVFWFTFEYFARLISSPKKLNFLKSLMNGIDFMAILPFYVGLIIETVHGDLNASFTDVRRFMSILRIFRIVRIFKMARHSAGLQVLGYTVRHSGPELGLLFLLLIMGMTLFASLAYYAEESVPGTKFESIIAAFWWALITMTTVGYGDMYPQTSFGQIVGSMCCVSGILFIALPIPTIVSNFSAYYKDHVNKERLNKLYNEGAGQTSQDGISSADLPSSYLDTTRLSVAQIEKHQQYRRRMSTISGVYNTRGMRVHPVVTEEEV